MWDYVVSRLTVLISLGIGTLLIVLYPMINKENKIFAWIGLIVGVIIIVVLLYLLLSDPIIRYTIFR